MQALNLENYLSTDLTVNTESVPSRGNYAWRLYSSIIIMKVNWPASENNCCSQFAIEKKHYMGWSYKVSYVTNDHY